MTLFAFTFTVDEAVKSALLKVSVFCSVVSSKPFAILHKIENPQRCQPHQNKR